MKLSSLVPFLFLLQVVSSCNSQESKPKRIPKFESQCQNLVPKNPNVGGSCSSDPDISIIMTIAMRAFDASIGLVMPQASPALWSLLDIWNAVKPSMDMYGCSTTLAYRLFKKDIIKMNYLQYEVDLHGFQNAFNGIHKLLKKGYNTLGEPMREKLWDDASALVRDMTSKAAHFRISNEDYLAGLYYIMPQFATLHISSYMLVMGLSERRKTPRVFEHNKHQLVKMIEYYSKVSFRYWRKARDNFCGYGDKARNCKSMKAPFHCFISGWMKLVEQYDDTKLVKKYIENAMKSLVIKNGDAVSFKSSNSYQELVDRGNRAYRYRDFTGSDPNTGAWLSCAGAGSWCYLRDCPGKYITDKPGACSGEKFTIYGKSADAKIRVGDNVGIKLRDNYWLSMGSAYRAGGTNGINDKMIVYNPPWWKTNTCPGNISSFWGANECTREIHQLIKPAVYDQKKKTSSWPSGVIENGEFVRIWWKGGCSSCLGKRPHLLSRNSNVMWSTFEIIKTGAETNKWDDQPCLPEIEC